MKGKRQREETKSRQNRGSRAVVSDRADDCTMTHMDGESEKDKSNVLLLYAILQSSRLSWFKKRK